MYDNEIKKEYALLVSVDTGEFDAEVSINELEELAHTAGAEVVGKVIQKKEAPEKATFVGVGKLAEIIAFCEAQAVDLLIFDSDSVLPPLNYIIFYVSRHSATYGCIGIDDRLTECSFIAKSSYNIGYIC